MRFIAMVSLLLFGFSQRPAGAVPLSDFLKDPALVTFKKIVSESDPQNPVELKFAWFKPAHWTPADQRPALVFIHGGAWKAGDDRIFYPHARYFASRGLVTFSINYRLLTPTTVSLADCFSDCKSALRFIRGHASQYGINPSQIAVFGDSSGGHLAAALGCCTGYDDPKDDLKISAVPDAVIACNPIMDLQEGTWAKFVIRGNLLNSRQKTEPADLILNDDQKQLALSLSPTDCIKPGQPPLLLMHGTDDHVVNPMQAKKFAQADIAAGNRCDLYLVPGVGHAFILAGVAPEPIMVDCVRRADAFLASLGWYGSAPTLEVSVPLDWQNKPKK